jgi:hypothetical protein
VPINCNTPVRRFHLNRKIDCTGVSGTGHVAKGAMFPDGQCVLWWNTSQSICIYLSLTRLLDVHGHGGKTEVVFDE